MKMIYSKANNDLGERFMNKNDWYETGDQIKRMVQDAVDSKDFTELGDTISDVVNQTVDGLQAVLKEAMKPDEAAINDRLANL